MPLVILGSDFVLCITGPLNFFTKPVLFGLFVTGLQPRLITSAPSDADGDEDILFGQVLQISCGRKIGSRNRVGSLLCITGLL